MIPDAPLDYTQGDETKARAWRRGYEAALDALSGKESAEETPRFSCTGSEESYIADERSQLEIEKLEIIRRNGLLRDGSADKHRLEEINTTLKRLDETAEECDVPPSGWRCTRPKGHDGPCAALPTQPESAEETCETCGGGKRVNVGYSSEEDCPDCKESAPSQPSEEIERFVIYRMPDSGWMLKADDMGLSSRAETCELVRFEDHQQRLEEAERRAANSLAAAEQSNLNLMRLETEVNPELRRRAEKAELQLRDLREKAERVAIFGRSLNPEVARHALVPTGALNRLAEALDSTQPVEQEER